MLHRLTALREALAARDLDALFVSNITNVRYLTGFTGSAGFLYVDPDAAILFVDSRYVLQARAQTALGGIEVVYVPGSFEAGALDIVGARPSCRLAFEAASVTVAALDRMRERLGAHTLVPTLDVVEKLRLVKDAGEIAALRRAAAFTDEMFDYVCTLLRPGVREMDVAADLEYRMRKCGADGPAFSSIVASGLNGAKPHAGAGEKVIEAGDLVTLDFGCRAEGYCADITRTVAIGSVTERQREIYGIVLEAQAAGRSALRPGATWKSVDSAARDIITAAGFGSNFGHGLGHSLGLEVHDVLGRLSQHAKDEEVVAANQVWTVEPGIYIEGWGGIRIEDDVLVTPDGPEVLTRAPRELIVL